eukprot:g66690.t1
MCSFESKAEEVLVTATTASRRLEITMFVSLLVLGFSSLGLWLKGQFLFARSSVSIAARAPRQLGALNSYVRSTRKTLELSRSPKILMSICSLGREVFQIVLKGKFAPLHQKKLLLLLCLCLWFNELLLQVTSSSSSSSSSPPPPPSPTPTPPSSSSSSYSSSSSSFSSSSSSPPPSPSPPPPKKRLGGGDREGEWRGQLGTEYVAIAIDIRSTRLSNSKHLQKSRCSKLKRQVQLLSRSDHMASSGGKNQAYRGYVPCYHYGYSSDFGVGLETYNYSNMLYSYNSYNGSDTAGTGENENGNAQPANQAHVQPSSNGTVQYGPVTSYQQRRHHNSNNHHNRHGHWQNNVYGRSTPRQQGHRYGFQSSAGQQRNMDFIGKPSEEIFAELVEMNQPDVRVLVAAWMHIGKNVRKRDWAQVKVTRSHPAFETLMAQLLKHMPSLQKSLVSNVWLGVRDLQIRDAAFLSALCDVTKKQACSLLAQHLANTLNAMAKLCYHPGNDLMDVLCLETLKKIHNFNELDIANVLNALAKLDHNPGQAVLNALCGQVLKKSHLFNAQIISTIFNALAKLNFHAEKKVLKALLDEVLGKARFFNAQDIATTLNAMAKLDCPEKDAALGALCRQALEKARSFNAQDVASTLNAIAKLSSHLTNVRIEQLLRLLCSAASKNSYAFNTQDLANTLNALAKLNHQPEASELQSLFLEVSRKAHSFNAQEVANTLNAAAKLNVVDYPWAQDILASLYIEARARAQAFNSQELAMSLNAVAKLGGRHQPPHRSQDVLRALCPEVLGKVQYFNSQDISNVLNACAKSGFQPGRPVLEVLCREASEKASSFNVQEIANALNALAKLSHHPGQIFLDHFVSAALQLSATYTVEQHLQNIVNTLHALVVFQHADRELFSRLLSLFHDHMAPSAVALVQSWDPEHLMQLHYIQLCLSWEHAEWQLSLPPVLVAACKQRLANAQSGVVSSLFHRKVSEELGERLQVPHVNEDTSSGLSVDILLATHKVAIEVDGPKHFVTDAADSKLAAARMYVSTTLCKQRLLRAMGYQLVSVPFFEWDVLSLPKRQSYLADKLRHVGVPVNLASEEF